MRRAVGVYAALSGFICVALGAFTAHALAEVLSDAAKQWIDTGLKYQMFHTAALLALIAAPSSLAQKPLRWSAGALALGILLFSGSLYALALTGWRWMAFITPLGGVSFLIGWACLALAFARSRKGQS